MGKKHQQQAAAKGLGSMVFTRDPRRAGRTTREADSISLEEATAVADRLKVPRSLLPPPSSDQKLLGMIASRAKVRFAAKGFTLKVGSRALDKAEIAVYRDDDLKHGGERKYLGSVCWERHPAAGQGVLIRWEKSMNDGPDDHEVAQYFRDRFDGSRGRIPIEYWADWFRGLALSKWMGLPARHEGRVFWIPEAFVPAVEQFSELTTELDVFHVVVLPVPDKMDAVVEAIIMENIGVQVDQLTAEVSGLKGTEQLARYERIQRELQNIGKLTRLYTDVLAPKAMKTQGVVLAQRADALLRTVEEGYIKPYHDGRTQAGLQRSSPSAIRRKRYLDLPKDAPEPPPATPIEMAPRPDPFMVVGGVSFHLSPKMSSEGMTCFAAEGTAATNALVSAFGELCDKWSPLGAGHMYPWTNGGPPRVYLTVADAPAVSGLERLNVTLHM
jgi:hypothetical protein